MQLIISPGGVVRCIYSESINLTALGNPAISRASYVEPDQQGGWQADLSPVGGPVLSGFALRSDALAAEQEWLEAHWLTPCDHNEMIANHEPGYAWKCAKCGHVYGKEDRP